MYRIGSFLSTTCTDTALYTHQILRFIGENGGSVETDPAGFLAFMATNRLKAIREARGLTQAQLGERANTTSQTIGRYEKTDAKLTLPILSELSRILRCTIGQLVGETPFDPEAADDAASPLERTRVVSVIDALDHYIAENNLKPHAGARGDLVVAIYDWSVQEKLSPDQIRDLTRISSLLKPALARVG